jgi:tRNA-specific 2-thiouridylase
VRIVVAMSGGVDSSVAAALLVEQGHEVIGVSMHLYDQPGDRTLGRCCTLDDLQDARRVAAAIGVPHYILNFERQFREAVIDDFVGEYSAGRTPLPCAHCNSDLKFSTLLDRARSLDAECVATGHYVRIARTADGRRRLRRSADRDKDQSYFLFSLTEDQVSRAVFPIGSLTKTEVRDRARRLGLGVADKPDSQEICFVPDGDYAAFVETHLPSVSQRGNIVGEDGRILGSHRGIHRFTIGQRKGLGLATGTPLYVLRIDTGSREVTVGPRQALERTTLEASRVNWVGIEPPARWTRAQAQIRHRQPPAAACVRAIGDNRAECRFAEPQAAVTPGQAVVFYDGDLVMGGGWID